MDLHGFADEALRTFLEAQPMAATLLGLHDLGLDGELADWSEAGAERRRGEIEHLGERLRAFDPEALELQDRITYDMLEIDIADGLDEIAVAPEEYTVSPVFVGAQAQLLQRLPKTHPSRPDLAESYAQRLAEVPRMLREAAERLSAGVAKGRTPPARAAQGAIEQIDGYLSSDLAGDPLAAEPPEGMDDPAGWARRVEALVRDEVRPAFAAFRDHVRDVVLPAGRPDERSGVCHLPDGAEVYRVAARRSTSTDRSPDDIHQLGLDIIASLDREYAELAPSVLGTGDRAEMFRRMREDASLRYDSRDQMVADARKAIDRAVSEAPAWFGRIPPEACEVRQVSRFEELSAPPAYYTPPATDGARPGIYWLNTYQPEERQRYLSESIAFHEAVPGHHFQIALAQKLDGLPLYRRVSSNNAYAEGWGLYSERLADEMGLYSSDLMRLGMLATDSWRACRLVVDTGLHHLGWSRQEAIDYLRDNSPVDLPTVESEVDRYIAMPGQALGYMVGRVEIVRLRDEAQRRLGDRFEVAGFHDTVLGSGSLPLTTLGLVVDDWIGRTAGG